MATADLTECLGLADLVVGRTGFCFAVLVKVEEKVNSRQEPYLACVFRAKNVSRTAKVWSNNRCINDVRACVVGNAYKINAIGENAYGSDLKLLRIEEATVELHAAEGFRLEDLEATSEFDVEELREDIREIIDGFADPYLRDLLKGLLRAHRELFLKMPAAVSFHHAHTSGLLEHVWSLTKVCGFLADHYAAYYSKLNPPLNRDLVLAAAIVHDIGKLVELNFDRFEASYSTPGKLIGHIVIGRDMVRDAARKVEGFPEETLMLLEHAILAHHGRRDFGSPVLPQTIEAMIVAFADDMDAKINAAARARLNSRTDDAWTDRVTPLDGRQVYKGIPIVPSLDEPEQPE